MRLWSIHPKYLDPIGLVALWRESLLAKAVIYGRTKGYTKHPQLLRFYNYNNPRVTINAYLVHVFAEAKRGVYKFDESKVDKNVSKLMNRKIPITDKQIAYEMLLLKTKLKTRNPEWLKRINTIQRIEPNHIFLIVNGEIENWEKVKTIK